MHLNWSSPPIFPLGFKNNGVLLLGMRLLLLVFCCSLLLGCAATEEPIPTDTTTNVSQPLPDNATIMTCEEYCPTLPHIQCVGQWNISGAYPDCVCEFICEVTEADETQEEIAEEPEEEPAVETTNKTIGEMMEEGMSKIRADFYSEKSGTFRLKGYTWNRIPSNASPGDIVFDTGPASDVKFDDAVIQSIQASGFVVFTNEETEVSETYGFAIFSELVTLLDSYDGSDAFDIWYFPPIIDKDLHDCWVYGKVVEKNEQGDWVSTYFFQCERITDK